MKKILSIFLLFSFIIGVTYAQEPLKWSFKLVDKGNGEVEVQGTAQIKTNWYMYDVSIPDGGPNPTTLELDAVKGAKKAGSFKTINSKLNKKFDSEFEMEVGYYTNQATFVQRFKVSDKTTFAVAGAIRAQACDDKECTPPTAYEFSFTAKDLPANFVLATDDKKEEPKVEETPKTAAIDSVKPLQIDSTALASDGISNANVDLWQPVIKEQEAYGAAGSTTDQSFFWIFLAGFGGGFLALLTPCVWPLIPMTVSFFLKRNKKSRKKAIQDAITYGLAIIVIYVALGLIITAIFGANALNALSTSAIFNLLFFALLVFFGISFLGAFEITLPSSWSNKIDSKADTTSGIVSIFFMAFTLALVSFSCTGPIIGTLIVEAASSGNVVAPAIGMFGFALALSIPFMFFAIFPSWLESLPKSGGWLNSVKVVLGFLELALALKFLSVADLGYKWRILDREIFLVVWIAIFVLLGIYLLGKLKLPHDSDVKTVSIPRIFLAIVSFSFAMYMIPGLWGAPLKNISAFTPPLWTQDFSLYDGAVHSKFESYEEGMEYAKKQKKPVIIDFSGYGCVNCRKMESKVWTDPRVKQKLENDYVLITLMVDDKENLPEIIEKVEKDGTKTKLRTIGDKWSYLQRHKFGTNSQPYYVLLNHEGMPIGPSRAYDEDIEEYIEFLNIGLDNFKKQEESKGKK